MKWITAPDLDRWANSIGSRQDLAELLGSLIRARATGITAYRFPTGDFSQLPGYDGLVEAESAPPWVPQGMSVWELGTGEDPEEKATKDYDARTKNPRNVNPAETTFVFVTPRVWRDAQKRKDWIEARKKQGDWADVRVIDGLDLEAWLDDHEAVAARFATQVLKTMPAEGVYSADEFWEGYSARARGGLTESVLLAGRQAETESVRNLLGSIPSRIMTLTDSRDEALAFVIAAIRTSDPEARRFIESRCVIVETDEAARRLSNRGPLIVGFRSALGEEAGRLLQKGSSVILPLGNDAPNQREAIRLPRPTRGAFAEALKTMGYDEEDAERMARECGRSTTILLRRIPAGARRDPEWLGNPANRDLLIPLLLAESWDCASPADCAAIEKLVGSKYADIEARLRPLTRLADPPIQQIGSVWTVVAPVDLFEMLAPFIATRELQALKQMCVQVLGEVDPAVDLPVNERDYASLHGKTLKHSSWLRDGLTQSLLLIAVRGDDANLACDGGAQRFSDSVISELPGLAKDHRLMASLHRQLPLLMEAAPDPLLQALGQLLEGDGKRLIPIFEESGLLGPNSYHTGLLWALELLAWDPVYFRRAVESLARLTQIDPGGKLGNRPLNSLQEIYVPWLPSTNAPFAMRMSVLDMVLKAEPEVGWKLLAELMPSFHGASMSTHKPRWRDSGGSEKEDLTNEIVEETYAGVIERALTHAGDDPARWETIIQSMSSFGPSSFQKAEDALRALAKRLQSPQARFEVWSILRKEAIKHRKFASADWAFPPDVLSNLDVIVEQLKPGDAVEQSVWLFDSFDPDLPIPYEQESDVDAEELRRRAMGDVISQQGVDGIFRLAQRAKHPGLVGVAAGQVIGDVERLKDLFNQGLAIGEPIETFLGTLSAVALERHGESWRRWVLDGLSRGWSTRQICAAISRWPERIENWESAKSMGSDVERLYWAEKPMLPISDPTLRAVAIKSYVKAERAGEALARFAYYADELPSDILFDLIDSTVQEFGKQNTPVSSNFGYALGEVLDALRDRDDVDRIQIARREYMFLPLLDRRGRHLALHDLLTSEASLFVEVLSDVFRGASQPKDVEVTEEQSRRATMGYRLLQSLRKIPGIQPDGSLDADAMRRWVVEVRELAKQADRSKIADLQLGELLAYSPPDPGDGAWPHRAVRDLLEDVQSAEIERGILSEQNSKRGVFTKAVFEGGRQERGLADQARGWAKASQRWPRTAATLTAIAEMWDGQAKRADVDAQKDQERLG